MKRSLFHSSARSLILFIAVPLILGAVSGFLSMGSMEHSMDMYASFHRPPLSPPGFLFPIVWTILYITMGISAWIIHQNTHPLSQQALTVYGIQLAINLLWPIFFFLLHMYLFSFFWLVLLLFFIVFMILLFYRITPLAAYLQIPYLVWIIFAGYLNLSIYLLNR